MKSRFCLSLSLAACLTLNNLQAAVVINEFAYDDTGTDNREYVEIYNSGPNPVDISGWTIIGRDPTTTNPSAVVPAATTLAAGAYYVVGNTGILNLNQTVASDFLENDIESIEIRDSGGGLIDAVIYESNKGITGNLTGSGLPAETGPGYFGNSGTGPDLPGNTSASTGRYVNGRDTNNNGRDFGMRPSTPGTTNAPGGTMTAYVAPDPTGLAVGTEMPGITGTFVNAKVIDPTFVDANNLNAIPAPPGGTKAFSQWDPSGGGNGATSNAVFATTAMSFKIAAYIDTRDTPIQINNAVPQVQFRGSEVTIYGLGGGDPLVNLTDLSTAMGLGSVALPASESANGTAGIAWVYEKVGVPVGGGAVSEKLYLVDANDGGDSDTGGNTPLDWTILATIDLSNTASGWYNLGISIDASGNGVAEFEGQLFNFTTSTNLHSGAFNVGYRENLQNGADGTPDAVIRQATFTVANVPESSLIAGVGALLVGLSTVWARRRRAGADSK